MAVASPPRLLILAAMSKQKVYLKKNMILALEITQAPAQSPSAKSPTISMETSKEENRELILAFK